MAVVPAIMSILKMIAVTWWWWFWRDDVGDLVAFSLKLIAGPSVAIFAVERGQGAAAVIKPPRSLNRADPPSNRSCHRCHLCLALYPDRLDNAK